MHICSALLTLNEPVIDTQFFPHPQHDFYWTSSPAATRKLEAWTVSFEYGFTTPMRRTDTRAPLVLTSHFLKNNYIVFHIQRLFLNGNQYF